MAPLTATIPQAWDIYVQELKGLGYGYPMWFPGPDPKYGNIQLGDIGFIKEGRFHLLFNCMYPKDHASHGERGEQLPQSFVPFTFEDPLDKERYCRGPDLAISQTTLTGITKRPHGKPREGSTEATTTGGKTVEQTSVASLHLQHPAFRTFLDCRGRIEEYMDEHGDAWLQCFDRENIVFVYGYTMTADWEVSAWVPVKTPEDATTTSAGSRKVLESMRAMIRMGTHPTPTKLNTHQGTLGQANDPTPNQCIFLDFYAHRKTRTRLSSTSLLRLITPGTQPAIASPPGSPLAATSKRPAVHTLSPGPSGKGSAHETASPTKASNATASSQQRGA